jgi:hypothetical protein
MLTLFVLSTLDGWPDYMYTFMDASDKGSLLFELLISTIKYTSILFIVLYN